MKKKSNVSNFNNHHMMIVFDLNHPELVYEKINELELKLIKNAGNDVVQVMKASKIADDLRKSIKGQLLEFKINSVIPKFHMQN